MSEERVIHYRASPTLARFHKAEHKFVRGIMGPLGSGKSVGCCWEIFRLANAQTPDTDNIRRSRFVVVRNTYRELADTTLETWRDWFPESAIGRFVSGDMTQQIEIDLPDGTRVESEILFRALDRPDDVKKLLSLELTFAWVNEARELPFPVIKMIQGRVGRFPRKRDGVGPRVYGVIMDTNPPDEDHWWHKTFEIQRPENWQLFRQPSALAPDAENLENLPDQYYENMMTANDEDWIKVYIEGEYGYVQDGLPVHPSFRSRTHVAERPFGHIPGRTIVVGMDFGLTPAAAFMQQDVLGRWRVFREEYSDRMGAKQFGAQLARICRADYQGEEFDFWGDPSGDQASQADETLTVFKVLNSEGIPAKPCSTNDWTLRRESLDGPLGRLIDGEPGLLISPTCHKLIKGLAGAYCRKRIQISGEARYRDKPDKNEYSHIVEALHYGLLGGGEGAQALKPKQGWTQGGTGISLQAEWSPYD